MRRALLRKAAECRPAALIVLLVGMFVIFGGEIGLWFAWHSGRPALAEGTVPHVAAPAGRAAAVASTVGAHRVPRPLFLTVPAIGVKSRLIRLGVAANGSVQVPATTSVAGWYTASARPGAIGPAVILGHVDSYRGPGIFFRLRWLHRGDKIFVKRADGSVAVFEVTEVARYLKSAFPARAVYGPVTFAAIRLITCGGLFDHATGHYLSNVVVYGRQIARRGNVRPRRTGPPQVSGLRTAWSRRRLPPSRRAQARSGRSR